MIRARVLAVGASLFACACLQPTDDDGFQGGSNSGGLSNASQGAAAQPADSGAWVFVPDSGSTSGLDAGPPATYDAGPPTMPASCDLTALALSPAASAPLVNGWGTDAPTQELREVALAMIGAWKGTRTTPWDGAHPVAVTFFANGTYSAAGLDDYFPFYYGEYCADHRSYWRVDLGTRALATGELKIWFEGTGTSTVEQLRHISAVQDKLAFDQWHFNQYGPIHFDLTRAP